MAKLFGQEYSKQDLLRRLGSIEQLAGTKRFSYRGGKANGLEAVELKNGTGLRFVVLPDRGLDIGLAEYKGVPLAFRSAVGEASPQYYEPEEAGWLRNFGGGLLTTCGLTYLGSPDKDGEDVLGLHGRISNLPAEEVSSGSYWEGDQYICYVQGKVREARALFGPNLVLNRRIWTSLGEDRLFIKDVVENEGYELSPLMVLYHFNIGFPILDEGSKLLTASKFIRPRDDVAAADLTKPTDYLGPTPEYPDTVYYHDLQADQGGFVKVALVNENLGLGIYLRFHQENLPNFIQWKLTNQGNYVTGLEPANCLVEGRSKERQRGTLNFLKPGESKEYFLEVGILKSPEAVEEFTTALSKVKLK